MTPGTVMDGLRRSQRGSALALALVAMLFLGMLIAGLMPMINQELKAGQLDRDILETRYVAEAGVKHALRVLADKGDRSALYRQTNSFAGNANKTYAVRILKPDGTELPAIESLADSTTYTIVSVGTVSNGPTWTARDTYTTAAASSGGNDTPIIDLPDPDASKTPKYAALSQGTMTAYSGTYTNSTYGSQYALASVAASPGFQWGPTVTTGVSGVSLDLLPASFFTPSNPSLSVFTRRTMDAAMNPNLKYSSNWANLWGPITLPTGKSMYEVAGDVVINTPLTAGTNNRVVIYSHGNITINDSLTGNFVFIAEGTIDVNGNDYNGQIELYSQGSMNVHASMSGYAILMTRGNLTVNGSSYVKALMFGRNSVVLNVNGPIKGAAYSFGPMTINANTVLTYDPSVIP